MGDGKKRILVVDDNKAVALGLEKTLELNGYEPVIVTNGWDALTQIGADAVDAAISDLNLPDLSGLEIAEKVLKTKPSFPFYIMTASDNDLKEAVERSRRARSLGIADYLQKPADIPVLSRLDQKFRVTDPFKPSFEETKEILVLDPTSIIYNTTLGSLPDEVIMVHKSNTFTEALVQLRTNNIGVLLVDYDLGGNMDGIDVAREIKRIYPTVETIFCTTSEHKDHYTDLKGVTSRFYIKDATFIEEMFMTNITEAFQERSDNVTERMVKGPGRIYFICGASGAGKTWTEDGAHTASPEIVRSIPYTTRPPREGEEIEGYKHFVSQELFDRKNFIHRYMLHDSYFVGISEDEIFPYLAAGYDVTIAQSDPEQWEILAKRFESFSQSIFLAVEPEVIQERQKVRKSPLQSLEHIAAVNKLFHESKYRTATVTSTLKERSQLYSNDDFLEAALAEDIVGVWSYIAGQR
tara:strand:- start:2343 stop:3740 length:1398 start_codon:yes stop_codon:yes gene_type:complete